MTVQDERVIGSICVAGAGIVGLSAAIAFARALPSAKVTLLELPRDPAALADRLPGTLPPVGQFHGLIGLDELELVEAGVATHRLGTRYVDWSADGSSWIHAYGDHGLAAAGIPFHHVWLRARRAGEAQPFHRYALAARLAEAGKFVHPRPEPGSPRAGFSYALRLDPELYRQRLVERATSLSIAHVDGQVGKVEHRGDGGIVALQLSDGRRIEADLFLDCAGAAAPLLSAVEPAFEDWTEGLPFDTVVLSEDPAREPTSCDTVIAADAGWRLESPLADRTLCCVLSAGQPPAGEGAAARLRAGRRPEPWVRNVLAIGDAAVAVDPLGQLNLYLAQSAIMRALALLPGRDCHPLELREYNRQTAQQVTRVRDFIALHYLRSGRGTGALWSDLAQRPAPDSLAHTLDQFEARGRLPFYEEETFDPNGWLAVLFGLGVLPRAVDPIALGVDEVQAREGMQRLDEQLGAIVRQAPPYAEYLLQMKAARRR